MAIKEIYSIRLNKDDEAIRNYLEQFPISKQTKAIKTLLKYGVEKLEEDYATNQAYEKLHTAINRLYDIQEEKLEEIKLLLNKLRINGSETSKDDNDEETLDIDKAKKSMEEALSMFIGL